MKTDFKKVTDNVKSVIATDLKNNYIKNMINGYEVAMSLLSEYAETHTAKEIKEFCDKCLEPKNIKKMENLANKANKIDN